MFHPIKYALSRSFASPALSTLTKPRVGDTIGKNLLTRMNSHITIIPAPQTQEITENNINFNITSLNLTPETGDNAVSDVVKKTISSKCSDIDEYVKTHMLSKEVYKEDFLCVNPNESDEEFEQSYQKHCRRCYESYLKSWGTANDPGTVI